MHNREVFSIGKSSANTNTKIENLQRLQIKIQKIKICNESKYKYKKMKICRDQLQTLRCHLNEMAHPDSRSRLNCSEFDNLPIHSFIFNPNPLHFHSAPMKRFYFKNLREKNGIKITNNCNRWRSQFANGRQSR